MALAGDGGSFCTTLGFPGVKTRPQTPHTSRKATAWLVQLETEQVKRRAGTTQMAPAPAHEAQKAIGGLWGLLWGCAIPWCCFSIRTCHSNWYFWAPGTGCSSQHGTAVLCARLLTATICPQKIPGFAKSSHPLPCRLADTSPTGSSHQLRLHHPKKGSLRGAEFGSPWGSAPQGLARFVSILLPVPGGGTQPPRHQPPWRSRPHKGWGWNNSPLEATRRGTSAND